MIKIEFHAMGSRMAAFLDSSSPQAVQALESVPAWFEEWECALSRFLPQSELNHLNSAAGFPTQVSQVVWDVLNASLSMAEWTSGLVVPTILKSLEQEGYDRTFDQILSNPDGLIPLPTAPSAAPRPGIWRAISLDPWTHSICIPEGTGLDFGGIAKGWAAVEAATRLAQIAPALVDCGGDLAISSFQNSGQRWPVAIGDPLSLRTSLGMLGLGKCGVATSGIDYHRWRKDGQWKHHIIDPRTGKSAETDLLSVTLVAPDAIQAEAAAKAVLILGSREGLAWLEARPFLSGLLVLQDGRVISSNNLKSDLWSEDASKNYLFS